MPLHFLQGIYAALRSLLSTTSLNPNTAFKSIGPTFGPRHCQELAVYRPHANFYAEWVSSIRTTLSASNLSPADFILLCIIIKCVRFFFTTTEKRWHRVTALLVPFILRAYNAFYVTPLGSVPDHCHYHDHFLVSDDPTPIYPVLVSDQSKSAGHAPVQSMSGMNPPGNQTYYRLHIPSEIRSTRYYIYILPEHLVQTLSNLLANDAPNEVSLVAVIPPLASAPPILSASPSIPALFRVTPAQEEVVLETLLSALPTSNRATSEEISLLCSHNDPDILNLLQISQPNIPSPLLASPPHTSPSSPVPLPQNEVSKTYVSMGVQTTAVKAVVAVEATCTVEATRTVEDTRTVEVTEILHETPSPALVVISVTQEEDVGLIYDPENLGSRPWCTDPPTMLVETDPEEDAFVPTPLRRVRTFPQVCDMEAPLSPLSPSRARTFPLGIPFEYSSVEDLPGLVSGSSSDLEGSPCLTLTDKITAEFVEGDAVGEKSTPCRALDLTISVPSPHGYSRGRFHRFRSQTMCDLSPNTPSFDMKEKAREAEDLGPRVHAEEDIQDNRADTLVEELEDVHELIKSITSNPPTSSSNTVQTAPLSLARFDLTDQGLSSAPSVRPIAERRELAPAPWHINGIQFMELMGVQGQGALSHPVPRMNPTAQAFNRIPTQQFNGFHDNHHNIWRQDQPHTSPFTVSWPTGTAPKGYPPQFDWNHGIHIVHHPPNTGFPRGSNSFPSGNRMQIAAEGSRRPVRSRPVTPPRLQSNRKGKKNQIPRLQAARREQRPEGVIGGV